LRTVAASSTPDGELRGFLGRFLFTGDDVFKSVATLSGGEKGRLALAKLIYSQVNVLILDEPTNHLDIASCEALEDALNEYGGTIITVSHDRYFLDRVASQILFFGDEGVEYFDGGYTEFYDAHHRARVAREAAAAELERQARQAKAEVKPDRNRSAETRRPGKSPRSPRPEEIESLIQAAEGELQVLAGALASEEVSRDRERLISVSQQYQELEERIRTLYAQWEEALELAAN
jgi:ATP-binding cassette, subfamily F, member 3